MCEYSAERKRRAGEKRKVKATESGLVVIEHGGLQEAVSAKENKLSGWHLSAQLMAVYERTCLDEGGHLDGVEIGVGSAAAAVAVTAAAVAASVSAVVDGLGLPV